MSHQRRVFSPKRQKHWEKHWKPHQEKASFLITWNRSPLRIVEDDFIPHPITDTTLVIGWDDFPFEYGDSEPHCAACKKIAKNQRIKLVNVGPCRSGMAFTFATKLDAITFRMFYEGPLLKPSEAREIET